MKTMKKKLIQKEECHEISSSSKGLHEYIY